MYGVRVRKREVSVEVGGGLGRGETTERVGTDDGGSGRKPCPSTAPADGGEGDVLPGGTLSPAPSRHEDLARGEGQGPGDVPDPGAGWPQDPPFMYRKLWK